MRYTCPFCTATTKDDGSSLYFYERDLTNRPAISGFVLKCRNCTAVFLDLASQEDAYLVHDGIMGWFIPEQQGQSQFIKEMKWQLSHVPRTLQQSADLLFRVAYKLWRKHIGYNWEKK